MRSCRFLVAAIVTTLAGSIHAETCPVPEGATPGLTQVDAAQRIAFLESSTARAAEDAARWGSFWRTTFETTAVTGFALAPVFEKRADQIDSLATGIKSTVGFVFASAFVLPAERHRDPFGERREEPVTCARLAVLETRLETDAAGEARGRSLGMHLLGLAFNVGMGVGAGLLHHRWWTAISGIFIGGAIGELRIYTQPQTATRALDAYRHGSLETEKARPTLALVPLAGGAAVYAGWSF